MKNYALIFSFLLASLATMAQQPKLVIPVGHTNYLNYFAASPDGRYILTASFDRTTRLWDRDGHLIATLKESANNEVLTVDFSPDGRRLLTCSGSGVKLWNLSGELILVFSGSSNSNHARFSPDGQWVAAGSTDGNVAVWDIQGNRLWRERAFRASGEEESATVRELAFSPDGAYLAAVRETYTLGVAKIWAWDKAAKKYAGKGDIQLDESISSLVFAPAGDTLVTGSINGQIHVWDMKGALLKGFSLHNNEIMSLAAYHGRGFLSGSNDNTALLFNLDGKVLQSFQHSAAVRLAAFSSSGDEVLSFSDATEAILFWGMDGKVRHRLNGYGADVLSIAPSPDGGKLLAGTSNGVRLWDLTGREVLHGLPHHARVDEVAYSPDGRRMYTVGWDGHLDIFINKDSLLQSTKIKGMQPVSLSVSRDGSYVLTSTADGRAVLWDSLGREVREVADKDYRTRATAFSPDGQRILTASELLDARLWETRTGKLLKVLPHNGPAEAALFSPDGSYMLTRSAAGKLMFWDEQGAPLWEDGGWELFEGKAGFSPDSKYLAVPNGKNVIILEAGKTLVPVDTLAGHTGVVNTAVFSADGKWVFTGGKDGMLKIWDSGNGEEAATLIQLGANDWAVTSPTGLFDASPGAMQLMYYTVGNEVISLGQLDERYFLPGLLAILMGNSDARLKDVSKFDSVSLFPEVNLRIVNDELIVQLKERNGGIGKYSILINNKEVEFSENKDKQAEIRLDLRRKDLVNFYRPGPDNSVSVVVYNEAGWLKSSPIRKNYTPEFVGRRGGGEETGFPALPVVEDPELYAVCIGTSDYLGDQLDLMYPDKDAEAMHQALLASGRALFGAKAVHAYLLNTGREAGAQVSGKENIRAVLREIEGKAKSIDVLLLYFSGHGIAYAPPGKEPQFYYLTNAIGSTDIEDPEILRTGGISTTELKEWARPVCANKQVLIFDACNSGEVLDDLGSTRKDLNADQLLALERLKERTGMFVLSGSAANKSSYEATRYGQGLLTFSLLQGMEAEARKNNGLVDVSSLFHYALDKVPELAEAIGTRQQPRMAPPEGGQSFPIGIVNDTVDIPVAQEKPVFVRPRILDDDYLDPLGLEDELARYFRTESAKGAKAGLAYFDLPKYRNSYQIRASYEKRGDGIVVKGAVVRLGQSDKPEIVGKLDWQGPMSKIHELAPGLAAQAYGMLPGQGG